MQLRPLKSLVSKLPSLLPQETNLRRVLLLLFTTLLIGFGTLGWVAYGDPSRDVVFSGSYDRYDPSRAFFVEGCDAQGNCEFAKGHEQVMHFSFGDGVMGHPGNIRGGGRNPVALTYSAGLRLLSHPDYAVAALKWCTTGQIWQEFRTHGRHFIVQLPRDPIETAQCVQTQLPRGFSVSIADPMRQSEDTEIFAALRDH